MERALGGAGAAPRGRRRARPGADRRRRRCWRRSAAGSAPPCASGSAAGATRVRAEVPILLGVGGTVLRGSIDLLVEREGAPPLVVDYKTDRLDGSEPGRARRPLRDPALDLRPGRGRGARRRRGRGRLRLPRAPRGAGRSPCSARRRWRPAASAWSRRSPGSAAASSRSPRPRSAAGPSAAAARPSAASARPEPRPQAERGAGSTELRRSGSADESSLAASSSSSQLLQPLAHRVELGRRSRSTSSRPSRQRSRVSRRPAWPESSRSMISSSRSTAAS